MSNSLKDLGLSSEELRAIAEIKGYKSMSKGKLLSPFTPSKHLKKAKKPKISFSKVKIEEIRK